MVTELQVRWLVIRFQQAGSVEYCQHKNSGNLKERDLTSFKRNMGVTSQIWFRDSLPFLCQLE